MILSTDCIGKVKIQLMEVMIEGETWTSKISDGYEKNQLKNFICGSGT